MSYSSKVELIYLDEEEFDSNQARSVASGIVAERGYSEDMIGDVIALVENGKVQFATFGENVLVVLRAISTALPHVAFGVRGFGEAHRDIWAREYRDGEETFALGPPPDYL